MGRNAWTPILVVLLLAVLAWATPAWSQSPPPRGTDAPAGFEFNRFADDLLNRQKLLEQRQVHYVFMVDVTASVANDLLDFWRRDTFLPMCQKFLVNGDRVSIVPFGMHANWPDATMGQKYQRTDVANLVASFPPQVMDAADKGTDIWGSIGEVLKVAEKKGWDKENLFIVVLTDDQIQGQSRSANQEFQRLRARHLEGNPTFASRYVFTGRAKPKEYSIYTFSNGFPDPTALAKPRLEQVKGEGGTPPSRPGDPPAGASPAPGETSGSPAPPLSPSPAASQTPTPTQAPRTPRFPWLWLLALVALALIAWWLLRPVGFRYKIDGNPGKIRSSDRPVPIAVGSPVQEAVADMRVTGGKLVVVPRKGFSVPQKAGASGSRPVAPPPPPARGAAPRPPAPIVLAPGHNADYRMHELEFVRDAVASGGWSQSASGPQAVGTVKIEVARLDAAPARSQATAQKKGQKP